MRAEDIRDAKLAQVEANSDDWASLARMQFRRFAADPVFREEHPEMKGEDIRAWLAPFVGQPNHHNAIGSFVMSLLREGLIKYVRHEKTVSLKRHASKSAVYIWG